jgi:hypothetical protein
MGVGVGMNFNLTLHYVKYLPCNCEVCGSWEDFDIFSYINTYNKFPHPTPPPPFPDHDFTKIDSALSWSFHVNLTSGQWSLKRFSNDPTVFFTFLWHSSFLKEDLYLNKLESFLPKNDFTNFHWNCLLDLEIINLILDFKCMFTLLIHCIISRWRSVVPFIWINLKPLPRENDLYKVSLKLEIPKM